MGKMPDWAGGNLEARLVATFGRRGSHNAPPWPTFREKGLAPARLPRRISNHLRIGVKGQLHGYSLVPGLRENRR